MAEKRNQAFILAGGTDLLVRFKDTPRLGLEFINIVSLEELKGISLQNGLISMGALTTHSQIAGSPLLAQHAPGLCEAAALIGSPQIRNRGTLGGNLANASPAGDLIPPLYTLAASVILRSSSQGERQVAIEDFFTGPGQSIVEDDELLTRVNFTPLGRVGQMTDKTPARKGQETFHRFLRLGQRAALAISKVSLALWTRIERDDNDKGQARIVEARIALGAVAPTVIRAPETEKMLAGSSLTQELITQAAHQVALEATPIDDIRSSVQYRRQGCSYLLQEALTSIIG